MLIVYIHNDGTGTNKSANYTYQVCVNDVVIETGEFKGHDRDQGWRKLLTEIADESLRHVCGDCGAELQIVRPGKYQCNNCE